MNNSNLNNKIVEINGLYFSYDRKRPEENWVLKNINLEIKKGEILAMIGESGAGKSTLAKILVGLIKPQVGKIFLENVEITRWQKKELRKKIQYIFQNAKGSLDPKWKVIDILLEGARIHHIEEKTTGLIKLVLQKTSLTEEILYKYPVNLSGGEAQRVAIARALCVEPKFLIADEPASSLDIITKLKILSMLKKLVQEEEISILYITHDIIDASLIADRIAVIHRGEVVELSTKDNVLQHPNHPQTKLLIEASLVKI